MLFSSNELALARDCGNQNAMKTRLKASLIAASIAALPFGADAAGLGRLNVMSALGQPLRAEVELSANAQEMQSLAVRVPSLEAFKAANVAYSPVMSGLRLAVEQRGGRSVVKITSDRPVNAPFVDMLIELHWTGGQVLREYTFLLDPADLAPSRPVVDTVAPVARPQAPAPVPKATRSADSAGSGAAGSGGGTYEVKSGDTLRRIASDTRPEGVSLDQMVVALFRGNRSAFEADNINRLKAGKILSVPEAEKVQAIAPAEARKEILAHSADFESYRRNVATAVAAAPAQAAPTAGKESGGKITPKVAEPSAPAAAKDQVKVSSAEAARPGETTGSTARLQALEEDIVARDKALKDANARLAELEKSIQELQKLVELKSQGMAQAQQSAQGGAAAPAPVAPPPAPAAPPPAEAAAPAVPPAAAPAPTPAPEEAAAPKPKQPKPERPPRPEEPSFLSTLLSDPMVLAGGGGILALLLGYVGFKMRGRRQAEPSVPVASQMSQFPDNSTQSVVGAAGGQVVDTGNSSLLQTDFSQSGLASIDADEGVDPVAEADVYMAYGRDAQAEEILIDALKVDSTRGAVYAKLLEIYAQRKSVKQFESLATDFYSISGGKGPDWEKAAALGRKLDPSNPLYGGAGAQGGEAPLAAAAGVAAAVAEPNPEPASPVLEFADTQGSLVSMKETWALPGDLGQLSESMENAVDLDLTASLPVLPGSQEASPEPAGGLDFNLDLGDAAPLVAPEAPAPRVEIAESPAGLDFHLDVGPDTVPAEQLKPAPKPDSGDQAMVATMIDGDAFRLESADLPDQDSDLVFDLPEEAPPVEKPVDLSATVIAPSLGPDDGEVDLEKTSFNPDMLDFDFELDEGAHKAAAKAPMLDLSSIDLNLDGVDHETTIEPLDIGAPDEAGEAPGDAGGGEEVDTKLELARAYDEMGDRDGARELLEEVLKEGSTVQKNAARTLLASLG